MCLWPEWRRGREEAASLLRDSLDLLPLSGENVGQLSSGGSETELQGRRLSSPETLRLAIQQQYRMIEVADVALGPFPGSSHVLPAGNN